MDDFRGEGVHDAFMNHRGEMEKLIGEPVDLVYNEYDDSGYVAIRASEEHTSNYGGKYHPYIATFKMYEQPECCGVAVLTALSISREWKGRGLSKVLVSMAEEAARFACYGTLTATTISDYQGKSYDGEPYGEPRPENATLRRRGFRSTRSFMNPNSGNYVKLWFKDINE